MGIIKKWVEKRGSFISLTTVRDRMRVDRYDPKKNLINMLVGATFISYGTITLFLPTGSIPIILFGSVLMFSPFSLSLVVKQAYNDVKFKLWSMWGRL